MALGATDCIVASMAPGWTAGGRPGLPSVV